MSRFAAVPTAALDDPRIEAMHIRVLTSLCSFADKDGWCRVGQDKIALRARTNKARVSQAITDLCSWGWVSKLHFGKQRSNAYQVIMDREFDPEIEVKSDDDDQPLVADTENHSCRESKPQLPREQIHKNTVLNTVPNTLPTTSGQSPENGLFGELPEDEKPKAPKPEPASDDPRAQVWALAPPYLEANGTGARQARSLTGKLIKTCGPGDALIIAKSMIASETQDPVNYLGGAMRRHKAGEPPEEIRPKPKFEVTGRKDALNRTIYRHIASGALVVAGEGGWIKPEEDQGNETAGPGCRGNGPVGAGSDGQHAAADMPEVQPQPEEETRSMPRHLKAGAGDVDALPSLRLGGKA